MKTLGMMTLAALLCACGGSETNDTPGTATAVSAQPDATCQLNVSELTNGANAKVADSVWSCNTKSGPFQFAFFDDGAGLSGNTSGISAFTWTETSCGEFTVEFGASGTSRIDNLFGSVVSGILTFDQHFIDLDGSTISASCILSTL